MGHMANKIAAEFIAEQRRKGNGWLKLLFVFYAMLLVWVVLLKTDFNFTYLVRDHRSINLIPFYYGGAEVNALKVDIIANILVFLPLGVYLNMLGLDWKRVLPIGLGVSLCFEVLQFVFAIGVSDITDLITNTAGTALGLFGYMLLCRTVRNRERLELWVKIIATVCTALAMAVFFAFFATELLKI